VRRVRQDDGDNGHENRQDRQKAQHRPKRSEQSTLAESNDHYAAELEGGYEGSADELRIRERSLSLRVPARGRMPSLIRSFRGRWRRRPYTRFPAGRVRE
jgi:hypothetical protein